MAVDDEPKYYRQREEGDHYEMQERSVATSREPVRSIYTKPTTVTEKRFTIRAGRMPLLEEGLQPLKKVSPKVIGSLFDRVDFLRTRISEIQSALDTRKRLHEELIKEIDADIGDKQRMVSGLSNIDDIRDFKLDISTLRMEKRRENIQFWRDLVQLTTELRELIEEYQTESKIANLFRELKGG